MIPIRRPLSRDIIRCVTVCALYAFLIGLPNFPECSQETNGPLQYSIAARIGVAEAKTKDEEPYQFASIRNLDCDNDGMIYVLDGREACVKVFDQDGRFLRKMFGPGQGPRELSAPYQLRVNHVTGNLFIVQEHGYQIKEFDAYGNYIKTHMPPEQILYYFDFYDEDRAIFIVRNSKDRDSYDLCLYNLATSKVDREFAPFDFPAMSQAYQKFIVKDDLLWTCPGDRMELTAFDVKTGKRVSKMPIPEKYRKSEILRGEKWQAVRIYNFGQPLMIENELHILVTKQDFPPPRPDWPTRPASREIVLYKLENGQMRKRSEFPSFCFFVDFQTTWRNRLLISSSGYDLYPIILVLELHKNPR